MNRSPSLLSILFGIDLRTLAVLRVGIALLILGDLAIRWPVLDELYTDAGALPRQARTEMIVEVGTVWWSSPHMLGGSLLWQQTLCILAGCAALFLLVGYWTRWAMALTWFLLVGLQARHPFTLQGGDVLFRCLCFWCLFLPMGGCWSWDARKPTTEPPATRVLSIASACLLLQLACMYFFSSLLKTGDGWRVSRDATYYALQLGQFTTDFGYRLLAYPELLRWGTFAAWWLEFLGPFLAFVPLSEWTGRVRLALIAIFVGFHIGLGLAMELGLFPAICIVYWLAFLPTSFWDGSASLVRRLRGMPGHPETPAPHLTLNAPLWVNALAAVFGVFMLWLNYARLNVPAYAPLVNPVLRAMGGLSGLDQHWPMFSPDSPTFACWFLVRGRLADGTEVNLWHPDQQLPVVPPKSIARMYSGVPWRRHMLGLVEMEEKAFRRATAEFFLERWNKTHGTDEQVVSVEIVGMFHDTPPPGEPFAGEPKVRLLQKWPP